MSLKYHKTVKPIYKSNFNNIHCNQTNLLPLQFSTLLSFLITVSTLDLHLKFLNINENNACPYSMLFLTYLLYQNFLMYALSYTTFNKISYCCCHEICHVIYNQIEICSYIFHPGRLHFWGNSLLIYITS